MLAGAACPGPSLQPHRRGTPRRLWPLWQPGVQAPEALGGSRDQVSLGSRGPRGSLCTTEPGAVHVLPTRIKSASTTATWTSSGSTLLSESALGWGSWPGGGEGCSWLGPSLHTEGGPSFSASPSVTNLLEPNYEKLELVAQSSFGLQSCLEIYILNT